MAEHLRLEFKTLPEHTWELDDPDTSNIDNDDRMVMVCTDEENIFQRVSEDRIHFLQVLRDAVLTKFPPNTQS
jgi:hypothetical protein